MNGEHAITVPKRDTSNVIVRFGATTVSRTSNAGTAAREGTFNEIAETAMNVSNVTTKERPNDTTLAPFHAILRRRYQQITCLRSPQ